MAGAIDKSKFRTILVFDFVGPGMEPEFPVTDFPQPPKQQQKKPRKPDADQWPTISVLGQRLAADFTTALSQSLPRVKVQTWGDLRRTLPDDYASDLVRDVTTAWWIAQSHQFDAFVWPDLEQTPNGAIKLEVVCYRASDEQSLVTLNTVMSLTPAIQQMSETAVHKVWHSDFPTAGQTGYKYPRCEYCPQANYPEEAVADKAQGTVVMEVIVTANGRADEIRILHALPFGLTDEAISAVQRWRFDPALGPDGKPAAVRQIIEVTFHLFRQ
ncbi:MAG TPA: energy transducer TonB [Terriglobia bacterium]|nr:energy transducer TonB [Terriglobia bacterium]